MEFFEHKIKSVVKETSDAVSILFENIKGFDFLPGQYITVEQEINGEQLRRSYSLSSIPGADLRIGIKAVEKGLFSNYALGLKQGDLLKISAPEGRFVLNPNQVENKTYLGIAAGSGITPVLSMISAAISNPSCEFHLIYGNKTPDQVMYKSALEDLEKKHDNFTIHYAFSQNCGPDQHLGRIDDSYIQYCIKGLKFDQIFLCGPEQLIENSENLFLGFGYQKEQIAFELFSSSTSEDVITDDQVSITVILDDETHEFTAPKGMNLLDAVLEQDLDAPYSCKGGVCSSCIALITEGKAKMEKNAILTDSEIEEGLTITCDAHATTDKICINYDEA
ncbi:MAG: 2Fe-2S iron-sulfur cluster-binding protein [Flavobacteriaceae bacterium]